MARKILLDTNFLVAPFQLNVSIFEELEEMYPYNQIYTLDDALQEAKSIESGKYGKLVEKLIEVQDIEVLETQGEGSVDDLLVDISNEFIIATNDKELKQRLTEEGKEVVFIRSKSHLQAINQARL